MLKFIIYVNKIYTRKYPMNRKELIQRLKLLGLNQREFAELIGYSYQTVKQWQDKKIPKWVPMLLDHLETIQQNKLLAEKYGLCSKKVSV